MKYVIIRTDGKIVARPGMKSSYTSRVVDARLFPTYEAAMADRCPENERIVTLGYLYLTEK